MWSITYYPTLGTIIQNNEQRKLSLAEINKFEQILLEIDQIALKLF